MSETTPLAARVALQRSVAPRTRYVENLRDAIATASAVAREAGRLFGERVQGPAGIPASSVAIRESWLSAALQADFPGVFVDSVRCMKRSCGTTDRARLSLAYSRRGTGAEPPASVFVKMAAAGVRTRLFANVMRLGETEVRFYREVAPDLTIDHPRAFHAQRSGAAGRFILVCEDLVTRGVRFADLGTVPTLEEASWTMRELARLHAQFWTSPRLRADLAWLGRRRDVRVERFLCSLATAAAERRFADLVPATLPTRLVAGHEALTEAWARPPLTLIHGDVRAENLYFLADTVGFLDWQETQCGQGMRDVSCFLTLSLAAEARRQHERGLITLYLEALRRHGVAAPDLDAALQQHRLHAIYAWIAAASGAVAVPERTEQSVRTALERSSQAVIDLGSIEALDTLARTA